MKGLTHDELEWRRFGVCIFREIVFYANKKTHMQFSQKCFKHDRRQW